MIGGVFGYMGYDMIQYFEKSVNIDHQIDEIKIPDSIYIRPQIIIIVDNFKNNILICAPIYKDSQDISSSEKTEENSTTSDKIEDNVPSIAEEKNESK